MSTNIWDIANINDHDGTKKLLSPFKLNRTIKQPSAEELKTLAELYRERKLTKKVIYYYTKALTLREQSLGYVHNLTANSCADLANAYYEDGDISKAISLYEKALLIKETLLDKNHLEIAVICHKLADIYFDGNRLEKAHQLYKKALKIRVKSLGNHLLTASSYQILGFFYASTKEYMLSSVLFEKALHVRKSLLEENHADIATTHNNLGLSYYYIGEYQKAYDNVAKSIAIREKILEPKDKALLSSKSHLKMIYGELKRAKRKNRKPLFGLLSCRG